MKTVHTISTNIRVNLIEYRDLFFLRESSGGIFFWGGSTYIRENAGTCSCIAHLCKNWIMIVVQRTAPDTACSGWALRFNIGLTFYSTFVVACCLSSHRHRLRDGWSGDTRDRPCFRIHHLPKEKASPRPAAQLPRFQRQHRYVTPDKHND